MKAVKQYFPVVLFIMLHKVVLTSESVVDCEQSLFFFGIVEGSARFAIASLQVASGLVPSLLAARGFAARRS